MNKDPAAHPAHSVHTRSLSLRLKMLIGFGLLFSATLVLVVMSMTFGIPLTAYTGSFGHDRSQELNNLSLVADLKKERLLLWLGERKDDATIIAENLMAESPDIKRLREVVRKGVKGGETDEDLRSDLLNEKGSSVLNQHLVLVLKANKSIQKIQIADPDTGFILASTKDGDVGNRFAHPRLLAETPEVPDETSVDVERIPPNGNPYLIIARLMRDQSSRIDAHDSMRAALLLYVDTDSFIKPMLYTGGGLGETGDIVLVNQDARILMSLKYPLPDGTIPKVLKYQIKAQPALLAIQGKDGIVVGEDYRGVPVLAAYRYIKVSRNVGWGMVVKCDQSEVFGPLRQSIVYSSLIGMVALIAAGLLAILVAKRISRPVENLTQTAQAVSDGNLAVRAEVLGSDDVGTLALTFNTMIERIQHWHTELEKQAKDRTRRLNELNIELTKEISQRIRAEESLKNTNRRLQALSDCNQTVVRATEESSLVRELCRICVDVGGYQAAWVGFSQDDELKTVRLVAQWGFEERDAAKFDMRWADVEQGCGPTGTAIRTGGVSILRNAANDALTARWQDEIKKYGIGSLISFPLVVERQVIGAVTIAAAKPDAFDEDEVKILEELAGDLAFGIETLRTRAARRQDHALVVRANQQWQETFDAISDLIMVLDNQHRILRANRSMIDALGMSEQEVIGKSCFELVHGAKEPPAFCPHALLVADGKDHSAEVVEPRLGGIYDVRVSPIIAENGQVVGSVHINRDITARKQAEEALSRSESMLRGVLQSAPIGIGVVVNRLFKWTNEFTAKMTGYSQEELLGQSARMLYENDEEFERVGAVKYTQIAATGAGTTETRWKRKDGTLINIILSSTAIDHQDMAAGVVFTAKDITARKQAEEALKDSEGRYRAVFDNAGIGIDLVDRDGNVVQVNSALSNMFGYTSEEFCQLSLTDITHPDEREISKQSLARILNGEVSSYRLEKRYIRKDGGVVWGDLSVSAMRDASGRHNATVGVIADITERKRMEIALKESEERLRLIIDSSPIGIVIVQDDKYAYVNPRFVEIFGYGSAEEIQGLPVTAIYVSKSKDLILQRHARTGTGAKTISHYESVGVTKSGKLIDAAAWVTEIDYLGREASLAFVMDMTESKSLRSQLLQAQKMEAIGNLAGGVAHDFNNLLTVIQGYSELLLFDENLKDKAKTDLERINHAAQSGADLVRRLLMFSKKSEMKPRPMSLNQQIAQTKSLLSRTIPKTITIELRLADELPAIEADPVQIGQVLMNLAVNATDAMPDRGTLVIETQQTVLGDEYLNSHFGVKSGNYVLLTFSDTGEGIDKESLEHIFEPFFTTKSPGKGTGLGLAVVYGIVKQRGGHITCYSEQGVGTTFKIYLPVVETQIEPRTQAYRRTIAGGTETILLVDDEQDVRDLGERILTRAGYKVLTAADGRVGLDIFRKEKEAISLVILDLIMPEMDGHQCLKEILQTDKQAKVIVSSGYSANGSPEKTSQSGAKGFVGKPYDMNQLLQTVRDVLDQG